MDGGGDRVVLLEVQLRHSPVLAHRGVDGGLVQIPVGCRVDDVADHHLRDGLVLGDSGGGGLAPDELDMASALLVTSVVADSSLESQVELTDIYLIHQPK